MAHVRSGQLGMMPPLPPELTNHQDPRLLTNAVDNFGNGKEGGPLWTYPFSKNYPPTTAPGYVTPADNYPHCPAGFQYFENMSRNSHDFSAPNPPNIYPWKPPSRTGDGYAGVCVSNRLLSYQRDTLAEMVADGFKVLSPYIAIVVSFIPVVGTGLAVAISIGGAMARGGPISEQLISAGASFIPGGPELQVAYREGLRLADDAIEGKKIDLQAHIMKEVGHWGPEIESAAKLGLALASGQNIQTALYKTAIGYLPNAGQVLNSVMGKLGISGKDILGFAADPNSFRKQFISDADWDRAVAEINLVADHVKAMGDGIAHGAIESMGDATRDVARLLVTGPVEARLMSARELAAKTGVSETDAMRAIAAIKVGLEHPLTVKPTATQASQYQQLVARQMQLMSRTTTLASVEPTKMPLWQKTAVVAGLLGGSLWLYSAMHHQSVRTTVNHVVRRVKRWRR